MTQRALHIAAGAVVILAVALLSITGCRTDRSSHVGADAWTGAAPAPKTATLAMGTQHAPWTIAVQAYTFRNFTLMETAHQLQVLGVDAVEIYPGQTIGGDLPGKTHHSMDEATRTDLLAALEAHGITPVAYGVVNGKDAEDWEAIFRFAKDMGIGVVCCEPKEEDLETVAALCDKYGIDAALHNHADPSRYWNPQAVLDAVTGRTRHLGACVDNGHWARSGLEGVAGMKRLQGRIRNVHLKDVNVFSKAGRCVPFGTGVCNVPGIVAELRRQDYRGLVSIEYESSPHDPAPDVRACLDFLEKCVATDTQALAAGSILPAGMSWDPADTWQHLDPDDDGRWKEPETGDTSAYTDTTDDGKGTIEASGLGFDNEHYPNAFDNSPAKWCYKAETVWIQYRYPDEMRHAIAAYSLMTANDAPARDPRDWSLLGSNDDGQTWTVVDTRKDESWSGRHTRRVFAIAKPQPFNLYRLDITRNHGADICQLSELELLTSAPEDPVLTLASLSEWLHTADTDEGFVPLFSRTLQQAVMEKGGWAWEGDDLVAKGKGDIWTGKTYGDFVLDLEFKCEENTNSGIFLRCANIDQWLHTAIEVQILQPDSHNRRHLCGAIFDCLAPVTNAVRPAGEWNHYTIVAKANRIMVRLNGIHVLDMDLSQWTEAGRNPDGTRNKFKYAYRDMARNGHIGLQYHGQPVRFRNLRIRPLTP